MVSTRMFVGGLILAGMFLVGAIFVFLQNKEEVPHEEILFEAAPAKDAYEVVDSIPDSGAEERAMFIEKVLDGYAKENTKIEVDENDSDVVEEDMLDVITEIPTTTPTTTMIEGIQ